MEATDKKALSEPDICTKYITPALVETAGWNLRAQIREEVTFTKGRVLVRGRLTSRGETKRADYLLYYKPNIPIAVIEAKDNNHSVGSGMQQALSYAEMLDVPFVYSSNGDAFLEHDRTRPEGQIERELPLDEFPSPEELWQRYCVGKGIGEGEKSVVTQDYYSDGRGKQPRYYQLIAINRTIEAIAKRGSETIRSITGRKPCLSALHSIRRLWEDELVFAGCELQYL